MDTEVQKNTADIAALDSRMSSHEAMCEERWKTCFNRFDDIDSSVSRIETILISSAGAIIVGAATLIFTLWQLHQEKTMEMDYNKKDISKSPKAKTQNEIWQDRDGIWYFKWGKDKHGFTLEENAEIALKRFKDEEKD